MCTTMQAANRVCRRFDCGRHGAAALITDCRGRVHVAAEGGHFTWQATSHDCAPAHGGVCPVRAPACGSGALGGANLMAVHLYRSPPHTHTHTDTQTHRWARTQCPSRLASHVLARLNPNCDLDSSRSRRRTLLGTTGASTRAARRRPVASQSCPCPQRRPHPVSSRVGT